MTNKIFIYIALILLGIVIGMLGYSLFFNNSIGHYSEAQKNTKTLYTCGMHPNIIESEPGTCPICGMNLTPIKNSKNSDPSSENDRKIIYWRAPMNPNEIYDKPGKSQMGMDLVPVYEDEGSASGVVTVDGSTLQNMNVKMEAVKSKSLSPIIYTNGILQIDERKEVSLSTKFEGWIQKLYINFTGQKVAKGQKVVDIYSPQLIIAQQELITAVNYEATSSSVSKSEMLSNAIRKLELFDIRKEDIDKIISTKNINEYMSLYAPFNGTVLVKNAIEGEMIKTGMDIIKMADLSTLWLKADVYESDLNKVSIGDYAEVTFSYNPNKIYGGNISFIYPTVNQTTRSVTVRISIDNVNDELKPAMFGNVKIYGNTLSETLVIPETAVIRSGKNNTVILSLGEGRFKPVEVKLGLYSDGFYQILGGLKQNDIIVSSGQFMIDSESSLRTAVELFSSDKPTLEEKKMNNGTMENTAMDKKPTKAVNANIKEEKNQNHQESIVHSGIIDVESIDKNMDGNVFQDPMDWNVISDKDGKCPLCGMFLKEGSIDDAKMNLKMNGFEYK